MYEVIRLNRPFKIHTSVKEIELIDTNRRLQYDQFTRSLTGQVIFKNHMTMKAYVFSYWKERD